MAENSAKTAAIAAQLPLSFDMGVRIAGSFLFVAVHLCGVAFAIVYATAGLFHLSKLGLGIESAVVGIPTLVVCFHVLMLAITAERDPDNN